MSLSQERTELLKLIASFTSDAWRGPVRMRIGPTFESFDLEYHCAVETILDLEDLDSETFLLGSLVFVRREAAIYRLVHGDQVGGFETRSCKGSNIFLWRREGV